MKRQIQARAHSNFAQVREHTPIYDLDAYLQRQKKQKHSKLRINIFQTFTFFCAVLLISPILFMVG